MFQLHGLQDVALQPLQRAGLANTEQQPNSQVGSSMLPSRPVFWGLWKSFRAIMLGPGQGSTGCAEATLPSTNEWVMTRPGEQKMWRKPDRSCHC